LPLVAEWLNNPDYFGEFNPLMQLSRAELEKRFNEKPDEVNWFIIEKKDGTKIGSIGHSPVQRQFELGYAIIPSERGKGYCTEGVKIMVDYLFLSKDIERVQAHTDTRNKASQKVVENAGFRKEGIVRKAMFMRGEWRDLSLYSILREEWKQPKMLTKTTPKQ